MAVSTKTTRFRDRSGREIDVHHISLTKSNRKGTSEAVGGTLVLNIARGGEEVSWRVEVPTKVNGKDVLGMAYSGDIIFRTGQSQRWQIASKKEFSKRFSVIK